MDKNQTFTFFIKADERKVNEQAGSNIPRFELRISRREAFPLDDTFNNVSDMKICYNIVKQFSKIKVMCFQ